MFSAFGNTIRASNDLDPDQDRRSVGPDLGPTVCKTYQQTTKYSTKFFACWKNCVSSLSSVA